MQEDEDYFDDEESVKSKTQIKKEMHALQDLGIAISRLSKEQQLKIPLDDSLRKAVEEAPRIKGNSAKKRHMQFIGKLIRNTDYEQIEIAYEKVMEESHRSARQHHAIEYWRDQLIENASKAEEFIKQFPATDRQQLRQLVRASAKEREQNKSPANARKLFKFLRETIENSRN